MTSNTKDPRLKSIAVLAIIALVSLLLNAASVSAAPTTDAAQPAPVANDKPPIKIGVIASTTGVAAPGGLDMVDGIKLFIKQVNNKIAGRPVELIIENDESSPATAMSKVRKLVDTDKVDVLIGTLLANVAYAIAPITESSKVPLVMSIAAADDITQRKKYNWLIRPAPTASQPCMPFGEYVYKTLGYKRVITFGMDYQFGWEVVGGFQKSFEDAGGQVVQKIWAPLGFTDFKSYFQKMHTDADAVFLLTVGVAAEAAPKQYKEFGPKLPILGGGTSFDESILRHLGDESVGAVSPLNYSAMLESPANKKFVQAYKSEFKQEPSYYSEGTYTSGLVVQKAIESLKGDVSDKQRFLAALKKTVLTEAPRGPVKFDNHGQAIMNIYIRKVQKVKGKLVDTVVATFPAVSQFGKYPADAYLKQPNYSREYPPCDHCTP